MSSQWLLVLLFVLCPCVLSIKICAFNMHHFGEKKVAKEHVLNNIVKILQRCDLSLLQEVQDPKGLAVSKLLTAMNKPYIWDMFESVSSPQLGRKSYTEQYVFIYRPDKVTVMDQYKYADNSLSAPDVFAREPYIVLFQLPTTDLKDLVLVPQHTEPEKAAVELEALYDVFLDVKKRWSSRNIMFLGDFNADCRFLSKKKRRSLQLYSNQDFHWLIDDSTDTTVRGSTDCAYDRHLRSVIITQ
ncbi:deoxyribonuclease-1-like 1 isoform 2-T2 [Discoglossus pictus]